MSPQRFVLGDRVTVVSVTSFVSPQLPGTAMREGRSTCASGAGCPTARARGRRPPSSPARSRQRLTHTWRETTPTAFPARMPKS